MISFFSIQGNEDSGWDVVRKTFPRINQGSITLSVTAISVLHCEDQKTAEVAAQQIATLIHLPYVSDNTSVITVTPVNGCYMPFELTPTGGVIGRGTCKHSLESVIIDAKAKAKERNLFFIAP